MTEPTVTPVAAALGMSFDFTVDDKRRVVLQTHLPADAPAKAINEMMDRVFKALDRQEATYRLRGLQKTLADHEKTLRQIVEDMGSIQTRAQADWVAAGKRGDLKLSPKEAGEKRNAESTRDRYKFEIEKIRKDIADCETAIKQE